MSCLPLPTGWLTKPSVFSIKRCREILGSKAETLTDQEIDALSTQLAALADVALDMFEEADEAVTEEPTH